ncbi:hypothetical protein ACFE04_011844 [Oxalis oulophora]
MNSMLSSHQGVMLATTAMLVSSTMLYLAFSWQKRHQTQNLRSCLSKGNKRILKRKKKTKKVNFAENVKDKDGNCKNYKTKKLITTHSIKEVESFSCRSEIPANRVALYNGILRDRDRRIEKPTVDVNGNEPLGRLKTPGHSVRQPSISEDFWTTSTFDMDNSAVQSQGSISSISTINQISDTSSSSASEFVNHGKFLLLVGHFICIYIVTSLKMFDYVYSVLLKLLFSLTTGLLLWNQTRQNWVANKKPDNRASHALEPKLNVNATYDSLLGSNKAFPQPIPLTEMVDFLVDVWEQEGMYD